MAWFWLISVLGIITDLIAFAILFIMFIMPAQAFFLTQFVVICFFSVVLFLFSVFGLFSFKKYGRNIFLALTLLLNIFLLWFFSLISYLFSTILLVFSFLFIYYFVLPSTRSLFNKEK